MMNKVLIIGLGIGKLYERVLPKDKFNVVTLDNDPYKKPNYTSLESCKQEHPKFDLALVCVPNYLHEEYVFKLHENKMAKTILVEKPGLGDFASWILHLNMVAPSKLVMIKNNMYRDNYDGIIKTIMANKSDLKEINIDWLNVNRIPSPGSWFTNKKLAWGGVSRDLIPHLISIYYSLFKEFTDPVRTVKKQRYSIEDALTTQYGQVVKDGIYDVDDYCRLEFRHDIGGTIIPVNLSAAWKTDLTEPKIGIELVFINKAKVFYEFGLCPEKAYLKMIEYVLNMNKKQYEEQKHVDAWIHNIIDNVD